MTDARYRKLYPRIWHHPDFHALSRLEQLLALYLLTGPQTNRIGYYRLSLGQLSEDFEESQPVLARSVESTCTGMGWAWDGVAKVVFIPSWWRWNEPEAVNNLKGALKDYAEVPPSTLSGAFVDACRTPCERLGVPLPNPSSTPYRTPTERGTEGVLNGVLNPYRTQEQEQEQDQEQDQEQVRASTALTRRGRTHTPDGDFDQFWAVFPKKKAKLDAEKAWNQTKDVRPALDLVIQAVHSQMRAAEWLKEGGQFIPLPASWLRGRRWTDQPVQIPNISAQTARSLAQFSLDDDTIPVNPFKEHP